MRLRCSPHKAPRKQCAVALLFDIYGPAPYTSNMKLPIYAKDGHVIAHTEVDLSDALHFRGSRLYLNVSSVGTRYAMLKVKIGGVWKGRLLHRLIVARYCAAIDGFDVDHLNGDGLFNRRCNLRLCTHAENQQNQRVRSDSVSQIKGVRQHKNRWLARITVKGKIINLGSFITTAEAADAYDRAARAYFTHRKGSHG